jgi:hypothetical protein
MASHRLLSQSQGAECSVVQVAGLATLDRRRAGARADVQCTEGTLVDRVVEAFVVQRASTARLLPDATVNGDVPAKFLRHLAVAYRFGSSRQR